MAIPTSRCKHADARSTSWLAAGLAWLWVRRLPLAGVAMGLLVATAMPLAQADRIKDLATIQGVRPNQLVGYGLVVGLDGTGDQTTQTPFTVQSLITDRKSVV